VTLSLPQALLQAADDDDGAALRRSLQDHDEQLASDIADLRRRRRLLAELRNEQIHDAIDAAPSMSEQRPDRPAPRRSYRSRPTSCSWRWQPVTSRAAAS
jgi:hypothetical protein